MPAGVLVAREYNYGPPAVLENALDHVYAEWVQGRASRSRSPGWATALKPARDRDALDMAGRDVAG